MEAKHCVAQVIPRGRFGSFHTYQCSRPAVVGDYCKQHSPEAVNAREEESSERWRKACAQRALPYTISKLGLELANMVLIQATNDLQGELDMPSERGWNSIVALARELKSKVEGR